MKSFFVLVMIEMICHPSRGQEVSNGVNCFSIKAAYHQEFVLDGYVQVREWERLGDKMKLKDLGVNGYPSIQLKVEKELRKDKRFGVAYDQFFIRGNATFDRDIMYNGTIIDGRSGIDVSPTRYYRLTTSFSGPLASCAHFRLRYNASLAIDHITFYLDGQVSPLSKSSEVFERFGRQAFPYPVGGIDGKIELDGGSDIDFEVSGSYIPRFKSFYTEGGNVHLQYKNFQAGFGYTRRIKDLFVAVGVRMRYLYLFQESREDTNVITTLTWGPNVAVSYQFGKRAFEARDPH